MIALLVIASIIALAADRYELAIWLIAAAAIVTGLS